ncbi:MAG TPA: purine-nucleoside phosphorylase [Saprospiraceae bacterium]|nr:purine-nucleoside phosphorylase [Saprospiraceae bacterium]
MSIHIAAAPGDIAETVLISGDPLRAKYVADKMLTDAHCYSEIRGMFGFTGLYKGKRVSVQGTGIGIPSTAIYLHELIREYGVRKVIRIGTCGALQATLQLDQLILASGAYTDSNTQLLYYDDLQQLVKVKGELLSQAREIASTLSIAIVEGEVFSTDLFYHPDPHRYDPWINKGVLATEMETSILYAMAWKHDIQALSILSVSDNIILRTLQTAQDREEASLHQMTLALELA